MRNGKKPSKAKPYEDTADFKARIAALRRTLFHEPELPRKRADGYYRRDKGSAPTPSEVLGGARMPKLPKPPKEVARWLRSLGVKL
jgi:hypothetical protein